MEKRKIIIAVVVALIILLTIIIVGISLGGGEDITEEALPKLLLSDECPRDYESRPLLVVCMDGFRPDYLQRGLTPTLKEFAEGGVQAEYMRPSYPTLTFPNHYTIVTGLYPADHGIVANNFYDPVFDENFKLKGKLKNQGKWWGGEPIWNTMARHGKKSATYFWPGSEADIGGRHPDYWFDYDKSKDYEERIDQVLEWLMLPVEDRPQWISLYFSQPDGTGHYKGPDSDELNEELVKMDNYIQILVKRLKEQNIFNCINIIIVSDHGMASAGKEKVIGMDEYIEDFKQYASLYSGAAGKITFKNYSKEIEMDFMEKLSCKRDDMRVYTPPGFPKRLHFSSNRRIEHVLVDLDPGYTKSYKTGWALEGVHGYDNIFPEMNTIFLAHGPDFHSGIKVKPFQNIELYNLMCVLTDAHPAPNNGTWGSLHHVLKNPPPTPDFEKLEKPSVLRYPRDNLAQKATASGCEGDSTFLEPWMPSLDLTKSQEEEIESFHAPWGIPVTNNSAANISLLYHMDHITGYSSTIHMPLWTTFTMQSNQMEETLQLPLQGFRWSSDARLDPDVTPTCYAYDVLKQLNFSIMPLFPSAFSSNKTVARESSHVISNAIPVSMDIKDRWQGLLSTLSPSWIASQGPLNFILGPAFDYDSDSVPDNFSAFKKKPPVPTDLFCVITRCLEKVNSLDRCSHENVDSIAFIFHQDQPISNCLSLEDFVLKFSSRVKDVELVTDLRFFQELDPLQRIHVVLKQQSQLWPLQ